MELNDLVALSVLPGIARVRAAAVFKELRESSSSGDGLTLEDVIAVCAPASDPPALATTARAEAARLLDAGRTRGIEAIAWTDPRYPPLLRTIADPPAVLWVRGTAEVLTRPAVAIVGSR